jgi:hypothetical protein
MHASRACFVSGQQQQIFLPDLMPTLCALSLTTTGGGGGGVDDDEFPMVQKIEEDTAMDSIFFSLLLVLRENGGQTDERPCH